MSTPPQSLSDADMDGLLADLKARGFHRDALELAADGMMRGKAGVGEGTYLSPQIFVFGLCQAAWEKWGDRASANLATAGLWSTARMGEVAHLVSERFGLDTGPETPADYVGLDTGSLVLTGVPPVRGRSR